MTSMIIFAVICLTLFLVLFWMNKGVGNLPSFFVLTPGYSNNSVILIIPRYRYGRNMALLPSVVLLLIPVNLFYIRWPVYISLAVVCAQVEKYLLTVWFVSVAMFLISGSFLYCRQRMFFSWTFSPLFYNFLIIN